MQIHRTIMKNVWQFLKHFSDTIWTSNSTIGNMSKGNKITKSMKYLYFQNCCSTISTVPRHRIKLHVHPHTTYQWINNVFNIYRLRYFLVLQQHKLEDTYVTQNNQVQKDRHYLVSPIVEFTSLSFFQASIDPIEVHWKLLKGCSVESRGGIP